MQGVWEKDEVRKDDSFTTFEVRNVVFPKTGLQVVSLDRSSLCSPGTRHIVAASSMASAPISTIMLWILASVTHTN
jgi:hypothetical protein